MDNWPRIRDVLSDFYEFADPLRLDRAVSRCAVRFSCGLRVAPDDTIHPQDIPAFIRALKAEVEPSTEDEKNRLLTSTGECLCP